MHAPSLTPDEFRRVRRIFEAALEHPLPDRSAFVARACEDDPRLVAEVEQMLAGENQPHRLLDGDAQITTDADLRRAPGPCPSCRAILAATDRFCRECGTPVALGILGHEGRFRAGALFAGRFRIVAALGRGGMGEVYRAHDLELGQPVALKFLTILRTDERARNRLRTEVRLARQISHPNVCRVYDIGDAHGDLYLSMEYVDGEDLAALLKRIGRLPIDKGIEIARKLCAGLAAAHAKGVLHRDLKPGNIMIDGRGEVRIMDFGLAAIATDVEAPDVRSGTPAYMSPEQLAGREVSTQSDLYALGLVMYELFTGRPAFTGKMAEDLLRQRASHPAATPSSLIPDLSPRVERIILRCLEPDPKLRPASALDVAATLPGGDPLADALAAGVTPSPELVAAAGEVGSIAPAVGWACLATIALGIAAIVWMSQRTTITSYVPLTKSAEIMAERARTIAADLGYSDPPADSASGFDLKDDALQHIRDSDASPARWELLRTDRLTALGFWYRQSPQFLSPYRLSPNAIGGMIARTDPPNDIPGMLAIETDPAGRLAQFVAVPPRNVQPVSNAQSSSLEWGTLFRLAGLDIDQFTPTQPRRLPPVFADRQGAWEGVLPDRSRTPIHIEAAAYAGRPVYFDLVAPWSEGAPATVRPTTSTTVAGIYLTLFVGSAVLARHNLKLGRADRRGAFRTAAIMAVGTFAGRAWVARDVLDFLPLVGRGLTIAAAMSTVVVPWVFYAALEPYVRRVWPEMLIGWSRLLSGRLRNPLIGRDVLIGTVGGVVLAACVHLRFLIHAWIGVPTPVPVVMSGDRADQVLTMLASGWKAVAILPFSTINGVSIGLVSAVALVFLCILLRGRRRAAVAWVVLWTVAEQVAAPGDPIVDLMFRGVSFTIGIVLLVKFGLLANVVHLTTQAPLVLIALRFDSGVPFAGASYLLVGSVAALALFGFHTALSGQSLVVDRLLRENEEIGGARPST